MSAGRDDFRDDALARAVREHGRETPGAKVDDAIRAAARRAVGSQPRAEPALAEAREPWRWWMPIAAAATIGAIAIGVIQNIPREAIDPGVVSDTPATDMRAREAATATPSETRPPPSRAEPAATDAKAPARDATSGGPGTGKRDAAAAPGTPSAARTPAPGGEAPRAAVPAFVPQPPPVLAEPPSALPSAKPAAPPATAAAAAPGAAAELEPKRRAISPGAPAPDSADRAAAPAPPPAPAQAQARTQAQAAKIAVPESRTMAEGRVGVDTREAPPGSAGGGSPALRDRLDSGAPRRERASTQTGAGAPVTDARRAAEAAPATMSPPRLGASASAAGKSIDAYVAEIRRHLAGGDVESARRELAALRSAHADADDRLPEDLRRWAAGIPR
ncbi:MAG: hypothetical protein IT520_19315 [Burkholderiales bacterium]|nr:hypothetical protein [Burkholderiales bacterium]